MCPDIILANKRIAKLKILEKYDTYSIIIIRGISATGTPSGKNKIKYFSLWKQKAIKLFPIKKANEKKTVRIKYRINYFKNNFSSSCKKYFHTLQLLVKKLTTEYYNSL